MKNIFKTRFALLFSFGATYLFGATFIRILFYFLSLKSIPFSIFSIIKIFGLGFFYDLGVALYFMAFYSVYLLLLPSKWIGNKVDKIITYFIINLLLFVNIFTFGAEITFWDEFSARFNFISVDYLIYTYEVVENINQTYPFPIIIPFLIAVNLGVLFVYKKKHIFNATFTEKTPLKHKMAMAFSIYIVLFFYTQFAQNKQAEWSANQYENELSKNGIFSFFADLRSNELDYDTFYAKLSEKEAYKIVKEELLQENAHYTNNNYDNIKRKIDGENEKKPNIVLVCIESFSADFLACFGNKNNIAPNCASLAENSLFFTNMYATGTRTVRGMEALTLSVPPTPGNSIVRRPNNDHLFSIATILKQKNYQLNFIYGGDGYFDNMNSFFGGQGFDILDRDRGNPLSDNISTQRISIPENEITFENAWGICDEDLYAQAIKRANEQSKNNQPFFQFIMTTSNHKPYTFPENKIDLPQGSRDAAVKYTDFALGKFIEKAKKLAWFENTIFVIVADHCASSAGKWEVNIEKHHIPAFIFNLKTETNQEINKLASQIDLMPTLFGYLGWSYETELFGKDINKTSPTEERAFLGNYRTLGLLKNDIFTEINDKKQITEYNWDNAKHSMAVLKSKQIDSLEKQTIAFYQIASERFSNGKMKER